MRAFALVLLLLLLLLIGTAMTVFLGACDACELGGGSSMHRDRYKVEVDAASSYNNARVDDAGAANERAEKEAPKR